MRIPESSIIGFRQDFPLAEGRVPASVATRRSSTERLGFVFPLLLIWLVFEFGRPPRPMGMPLVISAIAFASWVANRQKQLGPQAYSWFALLGVMGVGVLLAANTYAAFWATKGMAVLFLAICLPLQAQLTTVRRVRIWLYTFLAVAMFIGLWAATHGGFGPSASGGGQDENYIAALMGMSIGLAYFALLAETRRMARLLLCLVPIIGVAAIGLANNPSRGGFLGLCAVGLYCVLRSKRKRLALGLLGLAGFALLLIAGPSFWAEIGTTADYQSGTGDVRLEIWKAGLRMWEHNPLFGVGADNFRWVIGDYQSAAQFAKFGRSLGGSIIAHSLHVEMLAEVGLLGALATWLLIGKTWRDLGGLRLPRVEGGTPSSPTVDQLALGHYADAVRAGMVAILVNGVFLSLFYFSHLWLLLAVGGALPFVAGRISGAAGLESGANWPFRRRAASNSGRSGSGGSPRRGSITASRARP